LTFTGNGQFTGTMTPITESVSTIASLVDLLDASVRTLIEGMKLTKTLDKVLKLVGDDNIDDACNQLDKFIKDVNKLIKIGELDAEDGDPLPLIEQAEVIMSVAGC
jgi:exonuclease VII small subunit